MKYYRKSLWPNLLTFGNLFLGFFAIILFSQGRFLTGSWLLVLAALMDGLDGAVARWVKSSSKFGGEVDSLADVVSFGVAPAVLVYFMMPETLGKWAVIIAAIPLLASASRLAKYNVLSDEHGHGKGFSGMPTPSSAMLFAGFYIYSHAWSFDFNTTAVWLSLVPLISLLMISPIPYRRLPVIQIHGARRPWLSIAALVGIAVVLLTDMSRTLFPLMVVYLLIGPIEWIVTHSGLTVSPVDDEVESNKAERRQLRSRFQKRHK